MSGTHFGTRLIAEADKTGPTEKTSAGSPTFWLMLEASQKEP